MNTWMNNPQYLAQVGHTLGGVTIVTMSCIAFGFHVGWIVALIVLIATAIKEFWYDMKYELPKQSWSDSTMDFAFWQIGQAIGMTAMWAASYYHRILP